MNHHFSELASQSKKVRLEVCEEGGWNERTTVNEPAKVQDGFGADDFLSRLPDLCMLKVFKHFTRTELFTMRSVSKRMRSFYYNKSLDKTKWEKGDLRLFQTPRGYAFEFAVTDATYPWAHRGPFFGYHYEAYKDEQGQLRENRTENKRLGFGTHAPRHDWVIPDELFVALAVILRHREANRISIERIPFDTPMLFADLHALLDDHRTNQILCFRMPCAGINADIRTSFAQLIRRIEDVSIITSDEDPVVLNEDVLRLVSNSRLCHLADDFEDEGHTATYIHEHRYNVAESTLRGLMSIYMLDLKTMTIKAVCIALLCTLYMNAREDELGRWRFGEWKFNVDERLHPEDIVQQMGENLFTLEIKHTYFLIRRMSNGMTAKIREKLFPVDGGAYLRIVSVIFRCGTPR